VFHTILVVENGRWKVVDQMSTNGTFVNGSKAVAAYLNSGDKIRIGTVECTFQLPTGGAKGPAATAASGGSSKAMIGVGAFVVVLALMFGAYFFLM
jgi:predicted component of type VI protein secretion system